MYLPVESVRYSWPFRTARLNDAPCSNDARHDVRISHDIPFARTAKACPLAHLGLRFWTMSLPKVACGQLPVEGVWVCQSCKQHDPANKIVLSRSV